MAVAYPIVLVALHFVLLSSASAEAIAQTVEAVEFQSTVDQAGVGDLAGRGHPRESLPGAPAGGLSLQSDFAWIKFAIILLAAFVWLRAMRLCMEDRKLGLPVDVWGWKLFVTGLVGIVAAIMLPAYLPGAVLLALTCLLPFSQFLRQRNSEVTDSTAKLQWKHLFSTPVERFRPSKLSEVNLRSGLTIGTSETTMVLLGKSVSSGPADSRLRGESGFSPGFQTAVNLLDEAVSQRATDLHISTKDVEVTLRIRVDGQLKKLESLPYEIGLSVINVFKVLCDLNIADKRRSQDGSFRADVNGRRLNFRVSSQGTQSGEKLSIRILDPAQNFSTFPALGMTERHQERMTATLEKKSGLVLFVGATGAGKSTTAYAGLHAFEGGELNVITIEDPIEYSIPAIDQIEVNIRAGQTFQSSLRSVLRQDADVVLIGEIRDEETAQIACQAATTGQLVLATLHASDSVSAIFRMFELHIDPHNVAGALRTIVAQQLIRKLCPECRVAYTPDDEKKHQLGLQDFSGELYRNPDPATNTCLNCNGRGFLGRTGLFELLESNNQIRDMIREKSGANLILSAARENGTTTLWDDGLRLVQQGIISVEELERQVDNPSTC